MILSMIFRGFRRLIWVVGFFFQAGISYTASTTVSLVLDSTPLSINYIVDAGSCVTSPTDTTDSETNSNVDSSSPAAKYVLEFITKNTFVQVFFFQLLINVFLLLQY